MELDLPALLCFAFFNGTSSSSAHCVYMHDDHNMQHLLYWFSY